MFKKLLPVGIGLVLIILIAVVVSVIDNVNSRTPSFDKADDVYVSYKNYDITYDNLYTLMKNQYGATELLNLVDEQLYKEEIAKVDVESKEFKEFVYEQVFGNKDLSEVSEEDAQKAWDDVISSLRLTGLITKEQASDKDYTNESSSVWTVIKDYYKLPYARRLWAKEAYKDKVKNEREDGEYFDMTNEESETDSIEAYYEEHYTGTVTGLFIPFTSEESALEMMKKYGINTLDKVFDQTVATANSDHKGWVKASYDYYSKEKIEASDMLSYDEVVLTFFKMYNEVYSYLNNGNDIITSTAYKQVLKEKYTAELVVQAIQSSLVPLDPETGKAKEIKYGMSVNLPTSITITGEDKATVTWVVTNTSFAEISEDGNKVVGKFSENDETTLKAKLSYTVTFKGATTMGSVAIDLNGKFNETADAWEEVENAVYDGEEIDAIDPFYTYELDPDFISKIDNDLFKFTWTEAEAEEINTSLSNYFSLDSTSLKLDSNPTKLYSSYTIKPVQMGNYYFLIIKLAETEAPELFKKDADGNNVKDENGKYIILDDKLYHEIVDKKLEELLTENAINEMIYERRQDHNIKIYDAYIEALYEYEYNNFYENTLGLSNFDKFEITTKNQKEVIVSFQTKAGDKNSVVEYKAIDLFNRLEKKYASSSVATLVENYILISNKEFNNIYNPYTEEVLNNDAYKNLMNSEVSTLRKNFEKDYFTYSYLAYYGFTPNFPAEYGWQKFIKDYFVVYSDQELLTASTYGGTIYADALTKYTDSLYDYDTIKAEMDKAASEWYKVSVVNLLITVDTNYNADNKSSNSSSIILEETDTWEFAVADDEKSALAKDLNNYAKELAEFMYQVASQTNAGSLSDQMNALVTLYNEAAYEYDEAEWKQAKANNVSIYDYNYFGKYKLNGLNVKFEAAASYDSSSSIMEEFSDKCKELWDEAKGLDLLDKTFDVPLLSEPFHTDYGYHMIAVLSASSMEDLPTQEEIEIFRAQTDVTTLKDEIKTVQSNIDTYSASGYNVSSYEAEKAFLEYKLSGFQSTLDKVLAKYEKESDYELDAEATARLNQWYTPAETEIEGGTLVTEGYLETLNNTINDFKFENKANVEKLKEFIVILKEECDRQNAE